MRNEYQSRLTHKKDVLDTYIINSEEIGKKQAVKALLLKESEALQLHQLDSFVVKNRSITISELTSEHSEKLAHSIESAIERVNSEIHEVLKLMLAENTKSLSEIDAQIAEMIAGANVPERIKKQLNENGYLIESYWESVSEASFDLVKKYRKSLGLPD